MRYHIPPPSSADPQLVNALWSDYGTRTETANYTASTEDHTIRVDASAGAVTVTLPSAGSCSGKVLVIKAVDVTNAVTIDGADSEEIDGATTKSLGTLYDSVMIQSDGSGWDILASHG